LGDGNPNYYSGINTFLNKYTEEGKSRSIDACGIFAHYQDIPVGWLLFTYEDDQLSFRPKEGEACIHIFVKPEWRRCGIGKRLLQMAAKMAEPDIVRVYDNGSVAKPFYEEGRKQNRNLVGIYS
jgi:GNAT superfamily N-acetyltransferase